MAEQTKNQELKSTGYELFILLLSLVSIFDLVVVFISAFVTLDPDTLDTVAIIDVILTLFFVFDFCYRFFTTPSKSRYFFKTWGWADLLACLPGFRVFRLFRVFRAGRMMRTYGVKNMLNEVVNNRAGSALYITMFSIIVLAEAASILVLKAEAFSPPPISRPPATRSGGCSSRLPRWATATSFRLPRGGARWACWLCFAVSPSSACSPVS